MLDFTEEANENLDAREKDAGLASELKAVRKCLAYRETTLRHPSLKTHKLSNWYGPDGQQAFEACAQNQTSNAYRVIWYYGSGRGRLTIAAIVPHL